MGAGTATLGPGPESQKPHSLLRLREAAGVCSGSVWGFGPQSQFLTPGSSLQRPLRFPWQAFQKWFVIAFSLGLRGSGWLSCVCPFLGWCFKRNTKPAL